MWQEGLHCVVQCYNKACLLMFKTLGEKSTSSILKLTFVGNMLYRNVDTQIPYYKNVSQLRRQQ
jgi:hypothetical protein